MAALARPLRARGEPRFHSCGARGHVLQGFVGGILEVVSVLSIAVHMILLTDHLLDLCIREIEVRRPAPVVMNRYARAAIDVGAQGLSKGGREVIRGRAHRATVM